MSVPSSLIALAPTHLPVLRDTRFDGTGFEVPLGRFAPEDRAILGRVYRTVDDLYRGWRSDPGRAEAHLRALALADLLADAHRLGAATRAAGRDDPAVGKVVHDIRGGGQVMVVGGAEMLADMPGNAGLVRKCVEAARDHAKIMRNLLPDIDPAVRAADEAEKAHGIDHFVSKWDGMTGVGPGGPVAVGVRCSFHGAISARCLETSSMDRVVYNYVNNAVRFAADGAVTLWIFPVEPGLVRWVVQNRVAEDQAAFLSGATGFDLRRLYTGGITRGGQGVGLVNCAELVADCFGLDEAGDAVAGGYLGAAVVGDEYLAWFHWPTYEPGAKPGEVR